jgi:hypothetical protein
MQPQKLLFSFFLFLGLLLFNSCNYFSYTRHTKIERLSERPSAVICDNIVNFRIIQGGWPTSKEDFMYKDVRNYEALKDFPYQTTEFKIKDSTEMTLYFRDHIKDVIKSQKTNKSDLNSFQGNIHFWKEADKFLWKINMK